MKIERSVHVQGHCPTLSDLPPEGIGRGHVDPQRRKVGWTVQRCHVLHDPAMRGAYHADFPVAPCLVCGPLDRVVPIQAFLLVGRVKIIACTFGKTASPKVLQQHHVTPRHKGFRHRFDPDDRIRLIVRSPAQNDRELTRQRGAVRIGRAVDICGQPDTVPHRDHHVLRYDNSVVRSRAACHQVFASFVLWIF